MLVFQSNYIRRALAVALSAMTLLISGCSSFDPYRLVSRRLPMTPLVPVPPSPTYLDEEVKRHAIDFVWHTINDRHVDRRLHGVDWAAARAKHEPTILAQTSDDEFWRALDRMTGELRDSHTRIHSPQEIANIQRSRGVGIGLGARRFGEQLIVTRVHPDSDAFYSGIRPGMRLDSVNGIDALTALSQSEQRTRDTSTLTAKQRRAIGLMLFAKDSETVSVRVTRDELASESIQAVLKARESFATSSIVSRVLSSGVAYIRFSEWSESLNARLQSAVTSMIDSPAMIIDLRDNPGGSADMVRRLVARFIDAPMQVGKTGTRSGDPVTVGWGLYKLSDPNPVIKPIKPTYTKPVFVLVNEASASASELFSSSMQDISRAKIIGEQTCGCLLAYFGYQTLPGGGALAYSELSFTRKDGSVVEGKGVVPDVLMTLQREDIARNRDRWLERAVELAVSAK
jgi:carboxyl-terminal processing protease